MSNLDTIPKVAGTIIRYTLEFAGSRPVTAAAVLDHSDWSTESELRWYISGVSDEQSRAFEEITQLIDHENTDSAKVTWKVIPFTDDIRGAVNGQW